MSCHHHAEMQVNVHVLTLKSRTQFKHLSHTACVLDVYLRSEPLYLLPYSECFYMSQLFLFNLTTRVLLKHDPLATLWQAVLQYRITRLS